MQQHAEAPMVTEYTVKRSLRGKAKRLAFQCPRCRAPLTAELDDSGNDETCPKCAAVFRVPQHKEPEPPAAKREAPRPVETDTPSLHSLPASAMNIRAVGRLIAMTVLLITIVLVITVVATSKRPTNHELERLAETIAFMDLMISTDRLTKPEVVLGTQLAFSGHGMRTEPIAIWRDLEPLLRMRSPNAADFREMNNLLANLRILATTFDVRSAERGIDQMRDRVREWQGDRPRRPSA